MPGGNVVIRRVYLAAPDAKWAGGSVRCKVVTAAEAREVAVSMEPGQFRRIIGADGVPLVTGHGTSLTEVDRRLAAAVTGMTPPPTRPSAQGNRIPRLEVTSAWNSLHSKRRASGMCNHALHPASTSAREWSQPRRDVTWVSKTAQSRDHRPAAQPKPKRSL